MGVIGEDRSGEGKKEGGGGRKVYSSIKNKKKEKCVKRFYYDII